LSWSPSAPKETDLAIAQRLANAVVAANGAGVRKVILFGSRARGDAKPDSDYDLLVVLRGGSRDEAGAVRMALYEVLCGHGVAAEPWVMSEEDDDLVALARGAGIEIMVERGLRKQGQGVCLLLGHRGRFRGNVLRAISRVRAASSLIQRLASRGQRLHEDSARLRRQPSPDDDHAVFVLIHVQGPALVTMRGLTGLGQSVDTPPATDDALDVTGGAGPAHREQPLLDLGRGHAGQRPHLGVGQLSASERGGQPGQRAEGPRHAHPLARGAEVHPDAPAQPVSAGAKAVVPAFAGIELADEAEQPGSGGVEVRGQLGDLVAQPVHLGNGLRGGVDVKRADFHGCRPPRSWSDSTPEFRTHLRTSMPRDRVAIHDFWVQAQRNRPRRARTDRRGRIFQGRRRAARTARRMCQAETSCGIMPGRNSFANIPDGVAGMETMIPVAFSEGARNGHLSLNQFVKLTSMNSLASSVSAPKRAPSKTLLSKYERPSRGRKSR